MKTALPTLIWISEYNSYQMAHYTDMVGNHNNRKMGKANSVAYRLSKPKFQESSFQEDLCLCNSFCGKDDSLKRSFPLIFERISPPGRPLNRPSRKARVYGTASRTYIVRTEDVGMENVRTEKVRTEFVLTVWVAKQENVRTESQNGIGPNSLSLKNRKMS